MRSIFNKTKTRLLKSNQNVLSAPRGDVVNALNKFQEKWAQWMQQSISGLSINSQLALLAGFVLSTTIYSIYLIGGAISGKAVSTLRITPVKKPAFIHMSIPKNQGSAIISKSEYENIIRFKNYMDSLSKSGKGKELYDLILTERPGLMDSVQLIENMYLSPIK